MPSHSRLSDKQKALLIQALEPFEPAVIYLFGSFGTHSQHPGSDIDIAFLPTTTADPIDCFKTSNLLADHFHRSVDLVDLTKSSTVLAKEVLRTGIPIDIRLPASQQQFEMLTLSNYARLNEERRSILAS